MSVFETRDPNKLTMEDFQGMCDEEIMAIELGQKTFMKKMKEVDTTRDYTIIVDASGSMFNGDYVSGQIAGGYWEDARKAVQILAPEACKCDPDGLTLYFFSDKFKKYEHVKTAEEVFSLFNQSNNHMERSTDLASVLSDAVKADTKLSHSAGDEASNRGRAETILVITDGEPNDKSEVERVIINATHEYMNEKDDLSITIIQIGNDEDATNWLIELDNGLMSKGAQFDVVDILSHAQLKNANFVDVFQKSVLPS